MRTAHLPPESEEQHFRFCSVCITFFKGRAFVQSCSGRSFHCLHKGISGFSASPLNGHLERSFCFATIQVILCSDEKSCQKPVPLLTDNSWNKVSDLETWGISCYIQEPEACLPCQSVASLKLMTVLMISPTVSCLLCKQNARGGSSAIRIVTLHSFPQWRSHSPEFLYISTAKGFS